MRNDLLMQILNFSPWVFLACTWFDTKQYLLGDKSV